jgi:hypothetical protein
VKCQLTVYREPIGPHHTHGGTHELRSFLRQVFQRRRRHRPAELRRDRRRGRCALEYNCVRWGSHDLQPQAGIGVYERGPDGLLAAAAAQGHEPGAVHWLDRRIHRFAEPVDPVGERGQSGSGWSVTLGPCRRRGFAGEKVRGGEGVY